MSDKPKDQVPLPGEPDPNKFDIGFDAPNPNTMFIQVPIAAFAEDREDGMALFYGKMREAEAIGAKIIKEKRMKKDAGGLMAPGGAPLHMKPARA